MIGQALRRLARRRLPWAPLAVATVIAAIAPRLGWRIPKWPETVMIVGGVALAALLAVRFRVSLARREEHERRSAERDVARLAFAAGLVWIEASEVEQPEAEALRQALARRHQANATTDTEALQREALAEAVRRGWLSSGRELVLEGHLRAIGAAPTAWAPDPMRSLVTGLTAAYAALLPLGCAQRLTTVAVAAFVGAIYLAFDAFADDGQGAFES